MTDSGISRQDIVAMKVGGGLIAIAFVFCVLQPTPSAYQATTARAILALGAAGIVQGFSGFLHISGGLGSIALRAGGPLAIALGIYTVDPPREQEHEEHRASRERVTASHHELPKGLANFPLVIADETGPPRSIDASTDAPLEQSSRVDGGRDGR
jgi:hypothetical protein